MKTVVHLFGLRSAAVQLTIAGILCIFTMFAAGCGGEERHSTAAVSGVGTVLIQPDTVQMSVSLSKTADTTQQAQEAVTAMVKQALQILQESGVEEKNINTASLRFYPEYEWGGTVRVLSGQKAEQIIAFSLNYTGAGKQTGTDKVSGIIDRLIMINGIELQQMQFLLKNNAEQFSRSRELAYQKAYEKAEQYAKLSGLSIVKILSLQEEEYSPVMPQFSNRAMNNTATFDGVSKTVEDSAVLPAGEMEITSRVFVEFLLK